LGLVRLLRGRKRNCYKKRRKAQKRIRIFKNVKSTAAATKPKERVFPVPT